MLARNDIQTPEQRTRPATLEWGAYSQSRKSFVVEYALLVPSVGNLREGWHAKAKRNKEHRTLSFAMLAKFAVQRQALPAVIILTRMALRRLDDDNLAYAFKATRDGVADWLRVDDRSPLLTWRYEQEKGGRGNPPRVRIEILSSP